MNWKIIGRSLTHKDMRGRILAVLAILLIFRILAHLPVPIGNAHTLHQVLQNLFNSNNTPQLLSFINVLSGGALANFSIMIAGLGPYINASIIMQLLTKAIPQLEALHKEGEFGQKKINQYTRILTFPLAIIQSIGSIYLIRQAAQSIGGVGDITAHSTLMQWVLMVTALTGGSMVLMWLGELVTEQSVGNGISLIITVGIVSRLPSSISSIIGSVSKGHHWVLFGHTLPFNRNAALYSLGILIAVLLITWIVVMLNEAARNLTVNYAKRVQGNRTYGGITTILPVKLITAGVVPIIFAVAFLSVPSFVGQLLTTNHSTHLAHIGTNLVTWFQTPSATTFASEGWKAYIYPLTYFLLVFIFTFFYTSITFNSKEIAENLHKQGGFIEGVRGGEQTERYLSKIVNRLTLFGAFSLGILAIVPIIAQVFISTSITIGGTSVLILVSVAIQTLRAVESRALMVTYDQYSQPEFFNDTSALAPGAAESLAVKRPALLRLVPGRRRGSKK
ncbi:MAG TPA: preprotein translocase subunit SecY [Verrucomicrobiae bacterium]|nr:preprotein translocase subunit SecY [Verrucomicrobiae bacterium]